MIQGHELSGAGLVIDITGFDATVERRDIAADDRLHPIWGDHLSRVRLRRLSVYAVGGWQLTVARQRPTS